MKVNPMNEIGCCFPNAPQCMAQSRRTGMRCRAPALHGKRVCRFHGGRAGAPRGPANGRYRHGLYTAEAMREQQELRELLRRSREIEASLVST